MKTVERHSIWAHFPLTIREGTSDQQCFDQVFTAREYAFLDDLKDVRTIVDIGAYVGYSSAYFLSRWSLAIVVAIEPVRESFLSLVDNLGPYGDRARPRRAALWSHDHSVKISQKRYRDGKAWSNHVEDATPDSIEVVESFVMQRVLRYFTHDYRVSLLKMDIEGAEAVVFSGDVSWLDLVDNLVVEIHDDSHFGNCSEIINRVMHDQPFERSTHGELTYFRRV